MAATGEVEMDVDMDMDEDENAGALEPAASAEVAAAGGIPFAPTTAQCQSAVGPRSWSSVPRKVVFPSGVEVAFR